MLDSVRLWGNTKVYQVETTAAECFMPQRFLRIVCDFKLIHRRHALFLLRIMK